MKRKSDRDSYPTGYDKEALKRLSKQGGLVSGSGGVVTAVGNIADLMAKSAEQNDHSNQ